MYTLPMIEGKPVIIAVDFDGTLCDDVFPAIGKPNPLLIEWLKSARIQGHKLILWTCRVTDRLQEAVDWCTKAGLTFDAVNANLPENIAQYGTDCRKVFADIYIDDKSVRGVTTIYDRHWIEFYRRKK